MRVEPEFLCTLVESRAEPLVDFARDLVRIPTVNPPGENYRECAEMLGARLKANGFEVQVYRATGTPGDCDKYPRINVVGRRQGRSPGACVHFNSHLDVVPAGAGWTASPFEGELRDGRLYGRGACDMKGGLAASVIAVEAFLEACPEYPGVIEISGTADEETGGYGGVAWLAERGILASPRVDHVIIPEPLGTDRICLGHRGCWWAEIETRGRTAHGSMPFLGDCAVRHMGAVLHALETELFPALARRRTAHPVIPDDARASTLNINAIHGGQAEGSGGYLASCVTDSCRLTVDRRFHDPETLETVEQELMNLLVGVAKSRGNFDWSLRELWSVPPTATPPSAPVTRAVAKAIRSVFDRQPAFVLSPGTYDQKHVDRIGRLKNCIAYGPGKLELAHQPDEFIVIEDILESAKVMALALTNLLTASPAGASLAGVEENEI